MHERLNSAKYTREECGRITWRRPSMKKLIWDHLTDVKMKWKDQLRRLPGGRWKLQDETSKDGSNVTVEISDSVRVCRMGMNGRAVEDEYEIPIAKENEMWWSLEYTQKQSYWNILRSWRVLVRNWRKPICWWLGSDEWNHGGTKTFHTWKEGYWSTRIKVNIWKQKW